MIKTSETPGGFITGNGKTLDPNLNQPTFKKMGKKYENIVDYLQKGALAYSIGDYAKAMDYFISLIEVDWLKRSSYFFLVKTIIMVDIQKEILSLKVKSKTNNIVLSKSSDQDNN